MKLGIDASNIGGGGGVTHLKEILVHLPSQKGLKKVTVFASQSILDQLPDAELIQKITFPAFNKRLIHRVWFQLFGYDKYIKQHCDILFSVTGDYLGKFKPVVGMSRNMLLYERDIWKEIGEVKEISRFWINFLKQKRSFKNSAGIIFLSQYAKNEVCKQLNLKNKLLTLIHHGVSQRFMAEKVEIQNIEVHNTLNPFSFLYVSGIHVYKHQWNVITAIAKLRKLGYPVKLDLVGGIYFKRSEKKMLKALKECDSKGEFINYHGQIPYEQIHALYRQTNAIIFASTCENMPNILIESMSSGKPIACSHKAPMPEFLRDNGFYFDPYDVNSILNALECLIKAKNKHLEFGLENMNLANKFNWDLTTNRTFAFIEENYKKFKNDAHC